MADRGGVIDLSGVSLSLPAASATLPPIDMLLPLDPWDRSIALIGEGQGQGQDLLTGPTASVTRHDRH